MKCILYSRLRIIARVLREADGEGVNMNDEIYKALKEAIKRFYDQDAEKLLRGGSKRASERCIVNCIARYLWCLLQRQNIAVDVDVEYNLDYKDDDVKRIRCGECAKNDCKGKSVYEYIKQKMTRASKDCFKDSDGKLVYPDLIIHKRGEDENYLAVEFKLKDTAINDESKSSSDGGRYTKDALWDFAKLQYYACKKRMDGFKCYAKIVFVILKPNGAEYILPEHFPNVSNGNN